MSKIAEEKAYEIYPVKGLYPLDEYATHDLDMNESKRSAFICGYEQAEKDTIERALDWLRAHTKSYAGPIEEPFWTMFIEHFKKAMEE